MKPYLTKYQLTRLAQLRAQLQTLEAKGLSGSREWWSIIESIDSVEYGF